MKLLVLSVIITQCSPAAIPYHSFQTLYTAMPEPSFRRVDFLRFATGAETEVICGPLCLHHACRQVDILQFTTGAETEVVREPLCLRLRTSMPSSAGLYAFHCM